VNATDAADRDPLDLDLTAALDAAGKAMYAANIAACNCGGQHPVWSDLTPVVQHRFREYVLPVVAAAAPVLAAQARDRVLAATDTTSIDLDAELRALLDGS